MHNLFLVYLFLYIYQSLHVSDDYVPIIRRNNCVYATLYNRPAHLSNSIGSWDLIFRDNLTNMVSTPLWFTFRKSVKPSNFDSPSKLQNSIKLGIDKYVTTRTLLCKCLLHLLSYSNIYLSLSSVICPSYFTHDSFSPFAL